MSVIVHFFTHPNYLLNLLSLFPANSQNVALLNDRLHSDVVYLRTLVTFFEILKSSFQTINYIAYSYLRLTNKMINYMFPLLFIQGFSLSLSLSHINVCLFFIPDFSQIF